MYDYLAKARDIVTFPDHEALRQFEAAEAMLLEIFIIRQIDDSELRRKAHLIPQVQAILAKRQIDAAIQEKVTAEKLIKLVEESVVLNRESAVLSRKSYPINLYALIGIALTLLATIVFGVIQLFH